MSRGSGRDSHLRYSHNKKYERPTGCAPPQSWQCPSQKPDQTICLLLFRRAQHVMGRGIGGEWAAPRWSSLPSSPINPAFWLSAAHWPSLTLYPSSLPPPAPFPCIGGFPRCSPCCTLRHKWRSRSCASALSLPLPLSPSFQTFACVMQSSATVAMVCLLLAVVGVLCSIARSTGASHTVGHRVLHSAPNTVREARSMSMTPLRLPVLRSVSRSPRIGVRRAFGSHDRPETWPSVEAMQTEQRGLTARAILPQAQGTCALI